MNTSKISIIVAVSANGVIGYQGKLPWKLKRDLQNFKKLTTGCPIIMGRKTFESIGNALPHRTNIVVSKNKNFKAGGVFVTTTLLGALGVAPKQSSEIFFIGGERIFKEAMSIANRLYITHVEGNFQGDAFFKETIDPKEWRIVTEELWNADVENNHGARFVVYDKI